MTTILDHNLRRSSPRITPRPSRWSAYAIWGGALLLFGGLLAQSFVRAGIGAWAVGLVYITYDSALLLFVAVRTWGLGTTPAAAESDVDTPFSSLAVIIAAHNEADVLEPTIEALRRQTHPPERILIADDGSTDATAAKFKSIYGLDAPARGQVANAGAIAPELCWLRLPHGGKARALNAALNLVDNDIIITVDADTLLDQGALAAMRHAFAQKPELVAATGVLRPICGQGWQGRLFQWFQSYEYVRNFLSRQAWMQSESLLLISGAFAGFRRKPLVEVGGFDPVCLVEDYEVIHRLHRHAVEHGVDWRVAVIGAATACTDAPGALVPFLRQRQRWFAGFLQTQYWNRDMIGNSRFAQLGTQMLPVKALDTVQPLYGLSAFALLIIFLSTGNLKIGLSIIIAMGIKVVIDLSWLVISLTRYRRWTGQRLSITGAILAAIIEPVSFQLLRHAGAAWGWLSLITRRQSWGTQIRGGIRDRLPAPDII